MSNSCPVAYRVLALLIPMSVAFFAAGCGVSPDIPVQSVSSECPISYSAGVVWSSRSVRKSVVQLYSDDKVVAEIPISVQGVAPTDQTPLHIGEHIIFMSNGDARRDATNVIDFNEKTCDVSLVPLPQQELLNIVAETNYFVVTNNLNRVSEIHKVDWSGKETAVTGLADKLVDSMALSENFLYAFALDDNSRKASLHVFDVEKLSSVQEISIPDSPLGGGVPSSVINSGKMYYPVLGDDNPLGDTYLWVTDLKSYETYKIDLESGSPYYIRAAGDKLYVAHTFLNPGFQPLSDYRHVSVVDPKSDTVVGYDLSAGINKFDVNDNTLTALGEGANGEIILHSYRVPEMDNILSLQITPPSSMPDAYAANLFLSEQE